ncbi:hypothetical protein HIV01_017810 [Lysobacter arenosi]|jgi:hypothetical protein|uniref:Uncharacterized protein n=1 Tax=Lysobacter arenosi TaxID=2795387 RepID=A0ABX7RDJ0_9GAMM|nr:hypothetical protein [Lysobacter arenosi]QSX74966.1 hypothetical protein HIV01_017810 [Lysobacter arenosi]
MDGFEKVIEMVDFYDGPREGVALFGGKPHTFKSRMLDIHGPDDAMDLFDLTPLGSDVPVAVASAEFRRAADCRAGPGEWSSLEVRWSQVGADGT